MKKVAILQSNYIPWKGYFDLINSVDEFIIYDIVQFTKNDWRNRNRIKTPRGPEWLTIPVSHRFGQSILETKISDARWNLKHWRTIAQNYAHAKHFKQFRERIENLYIHCGHESLSRINLRFLRAICQILDIPTIITMAEDYEIIDGQTSRLVHLCRQSGATEYISGPAARDYIDESLFEAEGIQLSYFDYAGYPEYNQLFPPFDHAVSILDLIFNEGNGFQRYMKSFSASRASIK